MIFELSQSFVFEAAHTLSRAIDADASRRVHGHTYHCEVTVSGPTGADGMVLDLARLRQTLAEVRGQLDHRMLDDVPGLGPATLENLCAFVARAVPSATTVAVWRAATGDRCTLKPNVELSGHQRPARKDEK
jgi:6-pyruvoyltetrahydropterin/6-carboxytetrahydropterin synthase